MGMGSSKRPSSESERKFQESGFLHSHMAALGLAKGRTLRSCLLSEEACADSHGSANGHMDKPNIPLGQLERIV